MFFKVFQNVSEDFLLNMNSTTEVTITIGETSSICVIDFINIKTNKQK